MNNQKLLEKIRSDCFERISSELAKGEGLREEFSKELNRFYDLLIKAVESSDPSWLKPILIEWAQSRTQTEFDDRNSLPPILSTIVTQTFKVAKEKLGTSETLEIMDALLPIFTYCYEEIAYNETLVRISHVSGELERANRNLERVDRSKSDFISVAAHELKTPLTLIEGYASMLREKFTHPEEDSSSIALLKGIDNGTRRLGEIVSDMVDVSLIDNDLLALKFQPTWINHLLDVLQKEMSDSILTRNQILEIRKFEGSDEMIFADTERLYQALNNVLTNAIKYTPNGGKILIDGRKLAGFIEVLITDTGIGVNPDDRDRIFEKFGSLGDTALHSSGKLKFKGGGPGLGLPIVKGILDAHGGSIWVESDGYDEEKFPGSTFHMLIPLRKETPNEKLSKVYKPLSEIQTGD